MASQFRNMPAERDKRLPNIPRSAPADKYGSKPNDFPGAPPGSAGVLNWEGEVNGDSRGPNVQALSNSRLELKDGRYAWMPTSGGDASLHYSFAEATAPSPFAHAMPGSFPLSSKSKSVYFSRAPVGSSAAGHKKAASGSSAAAKLRNGVRQTDVLLREVYQGGGYANRTRSMSPQRAALNVMVGTKVNTTGSMSAGKVFTSQQVGYNRPLARSANASYSANGGLGVPHSFGNTNLGANSAGANTWGGLRSISSRADSAKRRRSEGPTPEEQTTSLQHPSLPTHGNDATQDISRHQSYTATHTATTTTTTMQPSLPSTSSASHEEGQQPPPAHDSGQQQLAALHAVPGRSPVGMTTVVLGADALLGNNPSGKQLQAAVAMVKSKAKPYLLYAQLNGSNAAVAAQRQRHLLQQHHPHTSTIQLNGAGAAAMSAATAAARQPKAYYPSASKPHTLPSKPLTTERHPVLRASTLVHGSTPGTGSTAAGALTLGTGGKLQPTAGSGSGGLLVPTTMAQAYHLSLAAALATGQNHHTSTTFSLASIPQQPPLSAAFPPKLAASFGSASFAMPASSSRLSQTADPGSNFTFPASPRSLTSTAVPGSRHDSNSPPGSSYLTAAQHRGFHPTATELGLSSERSEAMSSVPPVAKTKFMHQSNKHGPLTVLRPQDLFPKIVAESNDPRPITATVIRHPPAEPSSSNGLPAPQDGLQPFPIDSISVHVAPKPATPPVPVRTPMYARRGTPNLPIPVSYDPHPPPLLHEPSSSCSGAPEIAEGAAGGAMAAAEATTADAATAEAGSGDQTGCDVSFDDDVAQLPIDVAPPPAHSGGPKGESLLPPNVVLHLVEMTDVKSPSADPHAAAASSHSAAVQSQEPASGSPAGDQSQSKSVSTSVSSDVGMSSREHSFVDVGPTHGVGTTTRVESAFRSGSIDSVLEALISALPERTATPAPKQGTFSCTTAPAAASILDTLHTRNDAAAGAGTAAAAAVQLSIHPSILNSGTARSDLGAAGAAQPEPSTPLVVLADSRPSTLAGLLAEGLQVMSRPPTRPGRNPSEGLVGTASPAVTNSRPGTRAGVNTADAAVAPADLAETGSSPPHEFELHTQVLDSGDKQALDMLQEIAGSGSSSEVDGCLSSADEGGDEDVQSLNLSSPEDSDTEVDMNSGQAASSSRTTSKTLHHTSASHAIQLDDDTNTAAGIDASLANDTNAGLANDTDASLANDMVEAGVRVLGQKYEVQQLVGEGAYGMVTKCRVRGTDHYVAIKEFKIEDDDPDAEDVKRTSKREVDLLRCLKHPNVVGLVDEFYVRDHLFIVMEYVPCNLLELLEAQPGGMDRDAIRLIMFQLCTAMSFIHSQNIIFRDIKPENVLVDERGRLKLCDFGFARSMANMGSNRRLTDYVATRWYRAPELLLGPPYHASNAPDAAYVQSMYGQAVDMWAIGCVLGELSDGEPLFAGDSDLDQLYKVQQMLGPMSAEQQGLFNGNPHNTGIVFNIKKASTLGSRYQDKMSDLELDFMEGMLRMDPTQRLTAEQCLAHPYLANLVAADDKSRGENSASASSAVAALQVPVSLLPPPSRVGSSAASSGRFSALPPGLPTGTGHSDNGTGRITHSRRTSFTSEGKRASLGFESGEMSPMPRLGERTEGCPDWANQTVGPVKGRLSLEMTLLAPCPEDDALNLQAEDSASANAAVASQPVVEGSASAAPVAAMEAVSAVASQPVADGSASAAQTVPQPAMVDAAESATQPNADAASAPSPPPGGAGSSDAAAEPAEAATQPVISHSVADSAEAQRVSVSQIADPAAEPVVSLPTGGDAEVSPAQ